MMKKITLAALCLLMATTMMAQTRNVNLYRYVFNGWNTLCLPFSLSEDQVNEFFGSDCRLETLTNVTSDNDTYYLSFTDVKADGVKANTPYILYYTGESKSIKLTGEGTYQYDGNTGISFIANGATISFVGATKTIQNPEYYGIYVKDNAESKFTKINNTTAGFLSSRCYMQVEGADNATLVALHGNEATAINAASAADGNQTIYNVNGVRMNKMQKGINIVGGKKVVK